MQTCLIYGCTNQTVFKLCAEHWTKLPMALRQRWWDETNYGKHPPDEELLEAFNVYFRHRANDGLTSEGNP